MFIMSYDGGKIVNTEKVSKFTIQDKPDATLLVADIDGAAYVMGRYTSEDEAKAALFDLGKHIEDGYIYQCSQSNYGQFERDRNGYGGKKRKSHGGS